MRFQLDEEQVKKYEAWAEEVAAKGVEKQKAEIMNPGPEYVVSWEMGFPYTGAVGGEITFCFTPTSLGNVCVVTDQVTGEKINLTDYDSW